jgi:hypothetical protein
MISLLAAYFIAIIEIEFNLFNLFIYINEVSLYIENQMKII